MKLKTGLFFARMGKIGSAIGVVLVSICLLLIHNLGQDPTVALGGMAFYLVNYYIYASLVEYIEGRIKEEEKK